MHCFYARSTRVFKSRLQADQVESSVQTVFWLCFHPPPFNFCVILTIVQDLSVFTFSRSPLSSVALVRIVYSFSLRQVEAVFGVNKIHAATH